MECDLARLQVAILAKSEADARDWRQRARLAGAKVEEPLDEPESDDDFNDQLRQSLMTIGKPAGTDQ